MTLINDFKTKLKRYMAASVITKLPLKSLQQAKGLVEDLIEQRAEAQSKRKHLTHAAIGRLVHRSSYAEPRPIPFIKIELWDRNIGLPASFLGSGTTNAEGYFEIKYDLNDLKLEQHPDLSVRVIERDATGKDSVLYVVHGKSNVKSVKYDFGVCPIPYYEYANLPLPHILKWEHQEGLSVLNNLVYSFFGNAEALPQTYAVGRQMALYQSVNQMVPVALKHYLNPKLTLKQIQADYQGKSEYATPFNISHRIKDDKFFVYKILNGSCPCVFVRDQAGIYQVNLNWDKYTLDGKHYLPNINANFKLDGGQLVPVSIRIQEREGNKPEPYASLKSWVVYPNKKKGWEHAKHVLGCNLQVFTQISNHLAKAHFNVEQYALAAFRNLKRNPIRSLLFPHLKEVMLINVDGESAILGDDGIVTKNSALTQTALVEAMVDHLNVDWYGWKPRSPVSQDHHFAYIANLYWDILNKYVSDFIKDHRSKIIEYWQEIKGFSQDLVYHSIQYRAPVLSDGLQWVDQNELPKENIKRISVNGSLKMVSPITTTSVPKKDDISALQQACAYAIYHATLWHSWINDTTDALEPSFAQLNPTNRSSVKELTDGVLQSLVLSQTKYGYITLNEDHDIPYSLISLLKQNASKFEQYHYDIGNIRSRINI